MDGCRPLVGGGHSAALEASHGPAASLAQDVAESAARALLHRAHGRLPIRGPQGWTDTRAGFQNVGNDVDAQDFRDIEGNRPSTVSQASLRQAFRGGRHLAPLLQQRRQARRVCKGPPVNRASASGWARTSRAGFQTLRDTGRLAGATLRAAPVV